jgi:hypothetical protein
MPGAACPWRRGVPMANTACSWRRGVPVATRRARGDAACPWRHGVPQLGWRAKHLGPVDSTAARRIDGVRDRHLGEA